jgi:hypothetical protein
VFPAVFPITVRTLLCCGLPLLSTAALAATPLGSDGFIPFNPPVAGMLSGDGIVGSDAVETFDPVARAQLLAQEISRTWSGTYQSFETGAVVPVELQLSSLEAMGQIVNLRGTITIAGVAAPVQGNLNAESDQLDLLLLCDCKDVGGLEIGGSFSGLQGFQLSGWQAPRLTNQGGRLALLPIAAPAGSAGVQPAAGSAVRGLW